MHDEIFFRYEIYFGETDLLWHYFSVSIIKSAKFYFLVIKNGSNLHQKRMTWYDLYFITKWSGNVGLVFSCIAASVLALEWFFKQNRREFAYPDKYLVCISQWHKSEIPLVLISKSACKHAICEPQIMNYHFFGIL